MGQYILKIRKKPVKLDFAAAVLLEETQLYNIMHHAIQPKYPHGLVQAQLNLSTAYL